MIRKLTYNFLWSKLKETISEMEKNQFKTFSHFQIFVGDLLEKVKTL